MKKFKDTYNELLLEIDAATLWAKPDTTTFFVIDKNALGGDYNQLQKLMNKHGVKESFPLVFSMNPTKDKTKYYINGNPYNVIYGEDGDGEFMRSSQHYDLWDEFLYRTLKQHYDYTEDPLRIYEPYSDVLYGRSNKEGVAYTYQEMSELNQMLPYLYQIVISLNKQGVIPDDGGLLFHAEEGGDPIKIDLKDKVEPPRERQSPKAFSMADKIRDNKWKGINKVGKTGPRTGLRAEFSDEELWDSKKPLPKDKLI